MCTLPDTPTSTTNEHYNHSRCLYALSADRYGILVAFIYFDRALVHVAPFTYVHFRGWIQQLAKGNPRLMVATD